MGLDNPLHIAFLLIVLLLVFGARRLPEIGRSIGAGMREFKDSISGASSEHSAPMLPAQQPQMPVQQAAQAPVAQAPVAQPVAPPSAPQQAQAPAEPAQQA
jgi:sec-independent protein translocase protein TatA